MTSNSKTKDFINSLRGYEKHDNTLSSNLNRNISSKLRNLGDRLSVPREYEDPYRGVYYRPRTPAQVREIEKSKQLKYIF